MYWPEIFLGPGNTELPTQNTHTHSDTSSVQLLAGRVFLQLLEQTEKKTEDYGGKA